MEVIGGITAVSAGANEVISLCSIIQKSVESFQRRVETTRTNPEDLQRLKDDLSDAGVKISECEGLLTKYREEFHTESLRSVHNKLSQISDRLKCVENSVESEGRILQKRRRISNFLRSTKTADDILQYLTSLREITREVSELHDRLLSEVARMDCFQSDYSSLPSVEGQVYLDFSGCFTVEGRLKGQLLKSIELGRPDQARNAVGAVGMGGIGKTTASIALAYEIDIRKSFPDGIFFLNVGKDAKPEKLVEQLKNVLKRSGGKEKSQDINSNATLQSAITAVSSWFASKTVLFILDDLWPTTNSTTGYFEDLNEILAACPMCRMLITTRSDEIACRTTSIKFGPRPQTGGAARGMFTISAGVDEQIMSNIKCEKLVIEVLNLCEGIPLMLSVAGWLLRKRLTVLGWSSDRSIATQNALKDLVVAFNEKRYSLLDNAVGQYPSFATTIETSLEFAGKCLKKWCNDPNCRPAQDYGPHQRCYCLSDRFHRLCLEDSRLEHHEQIPISRCHCVMDQFHRLCVLPTNTPVSASVVFAIWRISDLKMGWEVLNTLLDLNILFEIKVNGKSNFGLHDVLFDYCTNVSKNGQDCKYSLYHRQFLSHAWNQCFRNYPNKALLSNNCGDGFNEVDNDLSHVKSSDNCRPWWLAVFDESCGSGSYLISNICRHLVEGARLVEAVAVLCHAGWTKMRMRHGGITALNSDYEMVNTALTSTSFEQPGQLSHSAVQIAFGQIWKSIGKFWSIVSEYPHSLPTHAFGHLVSIGAGNISWCVQRYLESAILSTTSPWLRPVTPFWPLTKCLNTSFHATAGISGLVVVWETRKIIAASNDSLIWIDLDTMTATRQERTSKKIDGVCLFEEAGAIVVWIIDDGVELRDARNGALLLRIELWCEALLVSTQEKSEGEWQNVDMPNGKFGVKKIRRLVYLNKIGLGERIFMNTQSLRITGSGWRIFRYLTLSEFPWKSFLDRMLAVSADSRWALLCLSEWDYLQKKKVGLWDARKRTLSDMSSDFLKSRGTMAVSSNGRWIVLGTFGGHLQIVDRENGKSGKPFLVHKGSVSSVAISPCGRWVVSGANDKTVRVWDRSTGVKDEKIAQTENDRGIAMNASGDRMVSISDAQMNGGLVVWDAINGNAAYDLPSGNESRFTCVDISGNANSVVSGCSDGEVLVWNKSISNAAWKSLYRHNEKVVSIAMGDSGKFVVSGSADATVQVWDASIGKTVCQPLQGHQGAVTSVAISEDGRWVVSGSADDTARVWNTETGTMVGSPLPANGFALVAVSADGQWAARASFGMVWVWNTLSGVMVGEPLNDLLVSSLSVSNDGKWVVCGRDDKLVHVWALAKDGREWSCFTFALPNVLCCVEFVEFFYGPVDRRSHSCMRAKVICGLRTMKSVVFDLICPTDLLL